MTLGEELDKIRRGHQDAAENALRMLAPTAARHVLAGLDKVRADAERQLQERFDAELAAMEDA